MTPRSYRTLAISYLIDFRKMNRFFGAFSAVDFRIGDAKVPARVADLLNDLHALLLQQRLQRGLPASCWDHRIGLRDEDVRFRLFDGNFSELVLGRDRGHVPGTERVFRFFEVGHRGQLEPAGEIFGAFAVTVGVFFVRFVGKFSGNLNFGKILSITAALKVLTTSNLY